MKMPVQPQPAGELVVVALTQLGALMFFRVP